MCFDFPIDYKCRNITGDYVLYDILMQKHNEMLTFLHLKNH